MPGTIVTELRRATDDVWATLTRQLQGMEPHLERSDGPGEWTTRQVLSHLLFQSGWDPVATLRTFAERDYAVVDIVPGDPFLTPERERMTLAELVAALDAQRRRAFAYLDTLTDRELSERKARIPLFKSFMGTDEIPLARFVGAMWDFHWRDHAGQLAKIRKAVGLAPVA